MVGDDGDDTCVEVCDQWCALALLRNFEFWMAVTLEPFDQHKVAGAQPYQQIVETWRGLSAQFMHQGPARAGPDEHLRRARLPVAVTVFTRDVDVERVMSVLDG